MNERAFSVLMIIIGLALIELVILTSNARAHSAKSGWVYPYNCCSSVDCSEIPKHTVKQVTGGYQVTLTGADHHLLTPKNESFQYFIPFDKVKQSQDEEYHLCIKSYAHSEYICFFAPPMSF